MIRKLILIIIIIGFAASANAQYGGYPKYEWYYLGAKFGPDFYLYELDFYGEGSKHEIQQEFDYSLGVYGGYCYNYWIEFRLGVQYSAKNFRIDYDFSNINVDPNIILPEKVNWNVSYLGIPLSLCINISRSSNYKFFTSIGIMPEFLLDYKETTTYQNGIEEESASLWTSTNFNNLIGNSTFSLGLRINFSDYVCLEIEPYGRYYFSQTHKDFMNDHPIAFGGSLGLFFNIY